MNLFCVGKVTTKGSEFMPIIMFNNDFNRDELPCLIQEFEGASNASRTAAGRGTCAEISLKASQVRIRNTR
jgi:hypothetical protein